MCRCEGDAMVSSSIQQAQTLQPKKYRNIIFDLGGVLVYFKPRELIDTIFHDRAEKPYDLVHAVYTQEWNDMDKGIHGPERVAELLSDRYNYADLYAFLMHIPVYLNPLHEGLEIMRAVQAAGYKTYVLSNMAHYSYAKIKDFDFLQSFDGHIYSCHVNEAKPHKPIYERLLSTYGLKSDESLFIDDVEANITTGMSLGIDGIVCSDHAKVLQELKARAILK